MYTPRSRDSADEPIHKYTPSKRGQAALDALALGYDVQLPECSFALLPRSSVSEQGLGSFISTGAQQSEQLPRSTSFTDSHRRSGSGPKQHRNRGSDISDKKRLGRQTRSPDSDGRRSYTQEDWILDSSTSQSSATATTVDSSSRASTSYQPSRSQYVLESPRPTVRPDDSTYTENHEISMAASHTPRSMANMSQQSSPVRRHPMIIHQTPSQMASGPHGQNKANMSIPAASLAYNNEDLTRLPGTRLATRSYPSRPSPLQSMTPLPEASSVERSLDAYFSPRGEDHQMNIQHLGGSAQYARIHSEMSGTPTTRGQPYATRPQTLKSPTWNVSGSRNSPVDCTTRQLPEREVFYGDSGPPRPYHHHSTSEPPVPVTSVRRNSRPQAGSQRPQLTLSSMLSPLPPSGASPTSGRYPSSKSPLRVFTQSILGSSTQSLRSAPLPSTSTSSLTMPSFHDEDEAFKVHPERAAVSRMETLLMLSACRAEVQGTILGGIMGHPATGGVLITSAGHSSSAYPGPSPQTGLLNYQNLARPNLLGLSDTKAQALREAPREMGFPGGTVSSAQERSPISRRPRQRSGSMGPSFADSTNRPRGYNNSYRHRQRSTSVIVQGLSPDAVKKLRMYEQLKNQDQGRPESLREIIGCTAKYRIYGARTRKTIAPDPLKALISPTQVALPPSRVTSPIIPREEASFAPPVAKSPAPPSPHNVPLPLSPPESPALGIKANHPSPIASSLMSSDSFTRYCVSQGIESPRPIRTRQNTISGRVIPTLRLISSPEGIDPRSETDISQTDPTEETREALDAGAILSSDERASLKSEGLKLDPQLERILTPTPPPAFWSPPPHSAIIRTSAPLPLLPVANVSTLSPTRVAAISLPATRTASAPPLRPMSAPHSDDPLRVGDSDDMRRVWSCQPASAELPPIKSFAGDWRQSMVIELSDEEEEEEEETTDTDFSELEDEIVDNCQVLDPSDVVVEEHLISHPETKSNSMNEARMAVASQDKPAERRTVSKGVVTSSVGSGINAVEAVQNALVKLAMDNAEAAHSQSTFQARPKRPAAPIRAGSMTGGYPTANQPFSRHSLDSERPRDPNPPHTLPNQYLGAIPRAYRAPNALGYPHTPTNLALDSLRSGLELRAAASVSAVEEAVRARSASPSYPPQDGLVPGLRSSPGFVLPPRLQRLHSVHPRAAPSLPTPRLDIPSLQQRRASYGSPIRPSSPAASLYPGTFNGPQYSTFPRPHPTSPLVQERSLAVSNASTPYLEQIAHTPRVPIVPEASASSNRGQLANIIVDTKPIAPAPATAPLSRNQGERKRQTRRSAEAVLSNSQDSKVTRATPVPVPYAPPTSKLTPSVSTPTQSSTASPKPKQKGARKRWPKHRKNPASGQNKTAAAPDLSTPAAPSPKPSESTPTPKKTSVPPPKKESMPKPKNDSPPTPKDSSSSTPKPKRKYKPPKKHKSAKPGATPAPAPAVTS